jgi:hypothetical protein
MDQLMNNEEELTKRRTESTPAPINDSTLDLMGEAADISELLKWSHAAAPRLDFVDGESALDSLYRQAVEVAEEQGWLVPSRAEFEKQYQQETAKLRRHDEKD